MEDAARAAQAAATAVASHRSISTRVQVRPVLKPDIQQPELRQPDFQHHMSQIFRVMWSNLSQNTSQVSRPGLRTETQY